MYILLFLVVLSVIIVIHELGHLLVARRMGIDCDRFFVGFGPTLWSTTRNGVEYGIKALPLGGFVSFTDDPERQPDPDRLFRTAPPLRKLVTVLAGPATHFVLAAVLVFVALWAVGAPLGEPTAQVAQVGEGTPAEQAGVEPGDVIATVDGTPVDDFADLEGAVAARPGERVELGVERDGERLQVAATLDAREVDGEQAGFLGVAPVVPIERLGPLEAASATVAGDLSVPRLTAAFVGALGQVFSPDNLQAWIGQATGEAERTAEQPGLISIVGIAQLFDAFGQGGEGLALLLLMVEINIALGVLNLLPLPPLDGGHVLALAVERAVNLARRLTGRAADWRLDPERLTPVAIAVILLLVTVVGLAIYIDIVSPASQIVD